MNLKIVLVLCFLLLSRAADEQQPSPTLDPTIPTVTDEKKVFTDAPVQQPSKAPVLKSPAKPSIVSSEQGSTAEPSGVDEKTLTPTKAPVTASVNTEAPNPIAKPTVTATKTNEPTMATTKAAKTNEPTMATTKAAKTNEPTIITTKAAKTNEPTIITTKAAKTNEPTVITTKAVKTIEPTMATTKATKTSVPTLLPTTLKPTIMPTAELTTVVSSLAPTVEVTKKATVTPTIAATAPAKPTAAPTVKVTNAAPTASPTADVTSAETPTTQPMVLPFTPPAETQPTSASQPTLEPTRRGKKRRSQPPVGGGGTSPSPPVAAPLASPLAAPTGSAPVPPTPAVAPKPTISPVTDNSGGSSTTGGASESAGSSSEDIESDQGEFLAIAMALLSKLDMQVLFVVVLVVLGVVLFFLYRRRTGTSSDEYSVLPTSELSTDRPVKPDSVTEDRGWEEWEEDDADEIVRAQQSHSSGLEIRGAIQMASLGKSSRSSTPSRRDAGDRGSSVLPDVKIKPIIGGVNNPSPKPSITPSSKSSSSSSFKTNKSNSGSFGDNNSSNAPNERGASAPYSSRSSRMESSSMSSDDADLFAAIGIAAAPKFTPPKLSMPSEYRSQGGVKSLKDIEADVAGQWGGDDIDLDD